MMQAAFDAWAEMTSPLDTECDGGIRCGQSIWIWAAAGQRSFVASYAHRATQFVFVHGSSQASMAPLEFSG